jgi:alpha-1,3/alpha-1,6-mannosyltransferase
VPFDAWEEWSMGFADAVAVNSEFTRGVVERTWPGLGRELKVVYPAIDMDGDDKKEVEGEAEDGPMWRDKKVVLSINRFERKKDVGLAIRAYAGLPEEKRRGVRLVIAGMFCYSFSLGHWWEVFLLTSGSKKAAMTTACRKTSHTTAT